MHSARTRKSITGFTVVCGAVLAGQLALAGTASAAGKPDLTVSGGTFEYNPDTGKVTGGLPVVVNNLSADPAETVQLTIKVVEGVTFDGAPQGCTKDDPKTISCTNVGPVTKTKPVSLVLPATISGKRQAVKVTAVTAGEANPADNTNYELATDFDVPPPKPSPSASASKPASTSPKPSSPVPSVKPSTPAPKPTGPQLAETGSDNNNTTVIAAGAAALLVFGVGGIAFARARRDHS
jgi:LPXTG-motif cell wall-anchored protein